MSHPRILDKNKVALLVVDIQEAFRNVITDFSRVASRTAAAVRGFQMLDVPVFVTEQYPKGLGRTAHEIQAELAEDFEYIDKTAFSSCGAPKVEAGFRAVHVEQIVVCGLEAHVCVNQTVHDLLDRGYDVHLLTDCVGSRHQNDRDAGLKKMFSSGAVPSTLEIALFELLRDATHEKFKEVQQLVK
ncbi:MAG TPA: hydrolase [Pyrinomonadaceae bacterium]|nr:hydrolase [Pyrinomonadaceae bacterium]